MATPDSKSIREKYYFKLNKILNYSDETQEELLTSDWVNSTIKKIMEGEDEELKKKYEVRTFNGKNLLLKKQTEPVVTSKIIVPYEDSFEFIHKAYEENNRNTSCIRSWCENHDHMLVSKTCVLAFIGCYNITNYDRVSATIPASTAKPVDFESNVMRYLISRNQDDAEKRLAPHVIVQNTAKENDDPVETYAYVDFIDIQPDDIFTCLLIVQYMPYQFIQLRPLQGSDNSNEICAELYKIFMDFVIPQGIIIDAKHSAIFETMMSKLKCLCCTNVLMNVKKMDCSELKFQVREMIKEWVVNESTYNWAFGCNMIQWKMNNIGDVHGITPYYRMFKKCGKNTTDIPIIEIQ